MIGVTTEIEWNGDQAKRLTDQALDMGAGRMARTLSDEISRSMPQEGSTDPSPPGTPPNVQSGRLRSSLAHARQTLGEWRVGTNVKYAAIQEFGGSVKGGRPYIVIGGKAVFLSIKKGTAEKRKAEGKYVKYTKDPHTLPARPFMRPAIRSKRVQSKMVKAFIRAASSVFERGSGAA